MIKLPTGRGTVEEQLAEIRDYLEYQSRTRKTTADQSYEMLDEIYRSLTESQQVVNIIYLQLLERVMEQIARHKSGRGKLSFIYGYGIQNGIYSLRRGRCHINFYCIHRNGAGDYGPP